MSFFSMEIPQITPSEICNLLSDKEYPFYLDSGQYFDRIGRFSFWGFEPVMLFSFKDNKITYNDFKEKKVFKKYPFEFLKEIFHQIKTNDKNKTFPFQGGLVGFLSYELGKYTEYLPDTRDDDYNIPEYCFGLYDVIYVQDILKNKFYIAGFNFNDNTSEKIKKFENALKNIKNIVNKVRIGNNLVSNFEKKDYKNAIKKAKEYIFAGDIYQVNLSQRFAADFNGSAIDFYKYFRNLSPAPFGAFIDFKNFQILSNSPERYLFIKESYIETRPIKGTRPRGMTKEEDEKFITELKNSEKDKAEHLMIVDLERNDLGRIAKFNSVRVSEFEIIETYTNVHHMVSTVEAEIDAKYDIIDCIKNSYPGGSITGAPKIRSMEIIDELEPTYRSVYTGSIGYIGFNGDIDLNIAIRTAIIKDNKIYFQVGGGIVADSDPEAEYVETIVKAESFTKTLKELSNG